MCWGLVAGAQWVGDHLVDGDADVSVVAVEHLRVDAEGGAFIGMSDLAHHVGHVRVVGEQQRDERPPQRVRGHVLEALRSGRVGVGDTGGQDTGPDVVFVAWPTEAVVKTRAVGSGSAIRLRYSVRISRSMGVVSAARLPAGVLASTTVSRPCARSTSQRPSAATPSKPHRDATVWDGCSAGRRRRARCRRRAGPGRAYGAASASRSS